MCNIEGYYCYVNNDNITRANLFKDGLHLLDTGKQILVDNFVFNVNRNFSHISSRYALDSSLEKIIYFDSNEDKLPDLEKLRDARLTYLEQPLFAYLNINNMNNINLRNKVILKEIVGCLRPDYLVISEMKLDDSFPSAQFNLPNYEIRATSDRNKNGGGLIEFVKKGLICKKLKIFEPKESECICSEITVSKKEWLCFSIYSLPLTII